MAIVKLGKSPLGQSLEEAVESALDDVFFIRGATARTRELLPRQRHQLPAIFFPQLLRRRFVALLQGGNPARYRAFRVHGPLRGERSFVSYGRRRLFGSMWRNGDRI